jgi:hypothetical protein
MQIKLPIFPSETTLFNASFGLFTKDDMVYYLHSGVPVGMHGKDDLSSFRCKIAQFISVGLCTRTEVSSALHIPYSFVKRCCQLYEVRGESGFWDKDERHGHAYKVTPAVLERIQKEIDTGRSVSAIAREEGLSESNIRYYLTKGDLKKNLRQPPAPPEAVKSNATQPTGRQPKASG